MKKLMAAIVVFLIGSRAYGQGASVGGDFTNGNNPRYTAGRTITATSDTFYTPCNPYSYSVTFQIEYQFGTGANNACTIVVQGSAEPCWNPTSNKSNNYVTLATYTTANTGRVESFGYVVTGNPYTYYRIIYTAGRAGQKIWWISYMLKR